MEQKIYNDYIPTKEDIKKQYKDIYKNFDDVEDLIYDGMIIEYFGLFYDNLYEIFKNECYAPKTLDDANNYLMHEFYKLDSVQEINGTYSNDKEELLTTKINKNNFYNAYYMPIWKNLNIKERAQVLKWHFDYKKSLFQNKDLKLRLIEDDTNINCGETMGMYTGEDMYIENSLLFKSNPFELITTIEHEFQHMNQDYNYKFFYREKKKLNNLYEKLILEDKDAQLYASSFKISPRTREALYLGYIMEQKAEKKALNEYQKINRANQNMFGKCPEQDEDTKEYIWNMMYRNGMLTVAEVKKSKKYSNDTIKAYAKRKLIMKNSNYLSKIVLLWIIVNDKNYELRKEEEKIKKSGNYNKKNERLKEIKKQKEKNAKLLSKLDLNYRYVLIANWTKLPKYVFKELNLEE